MTWAIGTAGAYLLFDLSWEVALVLGAVLVVSGPTVVGPLLEFIRPSKTVRRVLKWEGTLADPIGGPSASSSFWRGAGRDRGRGDLAHLCPRA